MFTLKSNPRLVRLFFFILQLLRSLPPFRAQPHQTSATTTRRAATAAQVMTTMWQVLTSPSWDCDQPPPFALNAPTPHSALALLSTKCHHFISLQLMCRLCGCVHTLARTLASARASTCVLAALQLQLAAPVAPTSLLNLPLIASTSGNSQERANAPAPETDLHTPASKPANSQLCFSLSFLLFCSHKSLTLHSPLTSSLQWWAWNLFFIYRFLL